MCRNRKSNSKCRRSGSNNLCGKIGKIRKDLFVLGFVLIVMVTIAAGDVAQNPVPADVNSNVGVGENLGSGDVEANAGEAVVAPGGTIQSINFKKDMRIKDALRFLAAKYQRNIIPSAKVDGVVAVTSLYSVTFEQAMDSILGYGFKYEQEGNFVKVYTAEEFKKIREDKERMSYKVFTLYYITAAEAAKLIVPVLSGQGTVSSSTPAEKDVTSSGGSGTGSSISSKGGGDSMALNDAIVIYDYPENIARAAEVIKALDVRPKQVLVEATILSATLTEGMELGVDLNLLGGTTLTGAAAKSATTNTVTGAVDNSTATDAVLPITQIGTGGIPGAAIETAGFAATAGTSGLRIGIKSGSTSAFITALESITDVTILANPKILAVNKQEGSVQIGKTLGYRGSSSVGQGGIVTQGEVQFLPTGTVLVFRPYIGNDGYIRMDIYPKDSTATLNVDKVPDETTTQLKSNILVKDGETIVIGGLFRDVVTTTRSQIPLLGDLPFIGAMFRSTSDSSVRQEVIVLLTPHIIDSANQTDGLARADDISRKRLGAKEELQWTGRTRLAEDRYAKAAEYYLAGDSAAALKEVNGALELRPTYLEALRLKERIIGKTSPADTAKIERNMLGDVEKDDSAKWLRR